MKGKLSLSVSPFSLDLIYKKIGLSHFDEKCFIYAYLRLPSFGLTPNSLIEAYRIFKGKCCLYLQCKRHYTNLHNLTFHKSVTFIITTFETCSLAMAYTRTYTWYVFLITATCVNLASWKTAELFSSHIFCPFPCKPFLFSLTSFPEIRLCVGWHVSRLYRNAGVKPSLCKCSCCSLFQDSK